MAEITSDQYARYLDHPVTEEIMEVTNTTNRVTAAQIHYTMITMFEIKFSRITTASLHKKMKAAAKEFHAEVKS